MTDKSHSRQQLQPLSPSFRASCSAPAAKEGRGSARHASRSATRKEEVDGEKREKKKRERERLMFKRVKEEQENEEETQGV